MTGRAVVIGTGAMAPEIAAACVAAGMEAHIAGRDPDRARAAALTATGFAGAGAGVGASGLEPAAFAGADLVIETIVEDLGAKRALLERVEPWCPAAAVIATNTSSLRIADIAEALEDPGRFGGLHFLKPAHLTAVVEVIPGPATGDAAVAWLREVAAAMGKTPLVVRADVPGFIWNRIQFAVLRECLHMMETGVASAADIDAAVSDGLAPRWMAAGPLTTADLGGLSTFAIIAGELFPSLSDADAAPELARRAEAGEPFAPWAREAAAGVAALRAEALAAGRGISARRRELGA